MNDLRTTIMTDTDLMASKRRFALFSQPPSIAIGDDSPYKSKLVRKGQDGKPITLPRNMLPGPNRSGVDRKSFITSVGSIYQGDKYTDPSKIQQTYQSKYHTKAPFHEKDFIPSSGPKTLANSPYKHIDQNPLPKVKPARDDTGRIISLQRNFTTNPTSKVDRQVFKNFKHIADPIERKSEMQSQQRKLSKQKMLPQLFRSMSHGDILFSSNKKIFGVDNRTQEFLKKKHSFNLTNPMKVNHQSPFIPVRRGHGDPIGKFPQFMMPDPEKSPQKSKKKEKKEQPFQDRQLWRHNGNKSLTRPTPSISYSSTNLRKYL